MPDLAALALVPLLIAINAFFVASEYAVVAIRPAQIELLRSKRRRRSARAIKHLKANPATAIGAIQVGITMANLLLGWIGEPAMSGLLEWIFTPLARLYPAILHTLSFALSFLLVTLLTVVFSELLPKALTLHYVPAVVFLTAVPVFWMARILWPLVRLMNALANMITRPLGLGRITDLEETQITADELRLMTTRAAERGELTLVERSLVYNSLLLGRRSARQIMVPRLRVSYLDLNWSMEQNRQVMNEYLYSRLPLCQGGMDNVIGIVHTKEFLSAYNAEGDTSVLGLIARPPIFLPERTTLDKLLTVFHERRTQMVFLVDEYGGVEGIVTLRDVVDELAGDLITAAPATIAGGGAGTPESLLVPGDTTIHDMARRLGRPEWASTSPATTLSGLVLSQLNRLPRQGEEIEVEGIRLRIADADQRTVRMVEVAPADSASTNAAP